jgi:hypothetical protein
MTVTDTTNTSDTRTSSRPYNVSTEGVATMLNGHLGQQRSEAPGERIWEGSQSAGTAGSGLTTSILAFAAQREHPIGEGNGVGALVVDTLSIPMRRAGIGPPGVGCILLCRLEAWTSRQPHLPTWCPSSALRRRLPCGMSPWRTRRQGWVAAGSLCDEATGLVPSARQRRSCYATMTDAHIR